MTLQNVIGGHIRPQMIFEKKGGLITGAKSIRKPRWRTTDSSTDIVTQNLYDTTRKFYPTIESVEWKPEYTGEQRVMADGNLRQFLWGYRFYITLQWEWIRGNLLRDIINNFVIYSKGFFILSTVDFPKEGIWVMPAYDYSFVLNRFKKTYYGHEFGLSLIGTELYPAGYELPLYIKVTDEWPDGYWNGIAAISPDFDSYKE